MLFVFESGRLGNQLFQYAAMRLADPEGKIIAFGMSELRELFACSNMCWISSPHRSKRTTYRYIKYGKILARKILECLCYFRLIGLVSECPKTGGVQVREGLLYKVRLVRLGYWQSQAIVKQAAGYLPSMHKEPYIKAEKSVAELGVDPSHLYFVHIRRGDYVLWPSTKYPAILPVEWYEDQIARIREIDSAAYFLIFSDDLPYIEGLFSHKPWAKILAGDMSSDFSLMTRCHGGGILSPSSYAWWAAQIARQTNPNAYYVAPLYWGGHRLGQWYPAHIETDWLDYQPVCPPSEL
jgi:hypothetical protein